MDIQIIPSIIAKTQKEFVEKIEKIWDFISDVHLDIMDGNFVNNESLNFDFKLPPRINFESHLMIINPQKWIEENFNKVNKILFHISSTKRPREIIDLVKSKKKKVGIVLSPQNEIQEVIDYLEQIDQVLIMTVNPGFYGSEFLPETLEKVRDLRKIKPELNIGVDGGINNAMIKRARDAGANIFVCGSYIINSPNPKKSFNNLWQVLNNWS